MTFVRVFAVAALGAASIVPAARAHTVGWSLDTRSSAVVLQFGYGGGEPMAFAEITVTDPDGRVYQQARADRAGKFALVAPPAETPESAGQWRVAAKDAEGHEVEAQVTPASPERAATVRASVGQMIGWLAVASVLLNVVLAGNWVSRRFGSTEASGAAMRSA